VIRGCMGLLVVCTLGCAGGGSSHHLDRAFAQEGVREARQGAPDLVAAAERARKRAAEAEARGDREGAEDHATRARLLLSAAVAEAERLRLEAERIDAERQARALEARALDAEQEREAVAQESRRLLAARLARDQASKAFEAAEEAETRRARRRGDDVQARYRDAARFLRDRARLVVAAAVSLGATADDGPAAKAAQALSASESTRDASRAVIEAERALQLALRALGEARARRDGPTEAEVASLVQTAGEMGLRVERSERGMRVAPPGRRWERRAIERLATLLASHPHGAVRVEGNVPGGGAAAERRAEARAKALATALERAGVSSKRMAVGTAPAPTGAPEVEVLLLAYDPATAPLPPR
jgi:hypothetical protein